MKRQAFVNWERVTEDNKPENGREYMVSEIMGEDIAVLRFATWYDKGSIVEIPKEQEENTEMTPEERLLQCIFGSNQEYVVPESGFYLLTSDYGIDDEFAGCTQMLVRLSDNIFFAEEPLVPEGYLTEEQDKKRMMARTKQMKAAMEEERLNKVKTEMANDTCINEVVNFMVDNDKLSSDNLHTKQYCYGIYTLSTLDVAVKVVEANAMINAAISITKREGGLEAVRKTLEEAFESETLADCIVQMIDHEELKDMHPSIKRYLVVYFESLLVGSNFYRYRDRYGKEFEDAAHVMVGAHAKQAMAIRLARCCRLREMGAPVVIQGNELRMLANTLIALSNLTHMEAVADGFEKEFGINKDGSKFEGKSEFGDYENRIEHGWEEDVEESNDNEEELIDRYVIVPSPNYAYKEGRYALWNLKQNHYYRENGQVMVFREWKTARDKRETINE